MRRYSENRELKKVVCNQCLKELKVKKGILLEGHYEGLQTFGYFSNNDGVTHKFDLCETCYKKMIKKFALPVEEIEEKELI